MRHPDTVRVGVRVVTIVMFALALSAGCEPSNAPNACNSDDECAAGVACRNGFCIVVTEGEGEEGEGEGEGEEGEGEGEEGEGEEGEGEGEGGEGEGEGEGEGLPSGTCATPRSATLGVNNGDTSTGVAEQVGGAATGTCLSGPTSLEQAWTITVPAGARLDIALQSLSNLGFYVRTACDDLSSQITCEDDVVVANGVEQASVVSTGAPLFIIVDTRAGATPGAYTLTLASAACGNGVRESGEECDANDLGGLTCVDVDGGPGTLTCDDSCQLVTTSCCGNGFAGGNEVCDGDDFRDVACDSGGTLVCADDCGSFNDDGCCENGVLGIGEICDSGNFGGQTCESRTGLESGLLLCEGCTFINDDGCCGNGVVGAGEECDDGNANDGDGCDVVCDAELVGDHGVAYEIYEGQYTEVADMFLDESVEAGTTNNFNIAERDETDLYGMTFDAYVEIATAGSYTFHVTSDDGTLLFVDNTLVVANDGLHSPTLRSGAIMLGVGRHAMHLEFFEAFGFDVLEVEYEGPGVPRQEIPGAVLFLVP